MPLGDTEGDPVPSTDILTTPLPVPAMGVLEAVRTTVAVEDKEALLVLPPLLVTDPLKVPSSPDPVAPALRDTGGEEDWVGVEVLEGLPVGDTPDLEGVRVPPCTPCETLIPEEPECETRGESLAVGDTRGESLAVLDTRGESLPLYDTRGESVPLPVCDTRGESLAVCDTRGESVGDGEGVKE